MIMKNFEFIFEDYLITDPNRDESMMNEVDPVKYYGKPYLEALEKFKGNKQYNHPITKEVISKEEFYNIMFGSEFMSSDDKGAKKTYNV